MEHIYEDYENQIDDIMNSLDDGKLHKKYVRSIINDQQTQYTNLYERLKVTGIEQTQIPEFVPIIKYLIAGLKIKTINTLCCENIVINQLRDSLICSILAVTMENNYYYGSTIRLIVKILEFFDIIIRTINYKIGNIQYYHKYRYERYIEYCINLAPKLIIFPTFENINASDILKMRAFPLFIIGISLNNIYVDEYVQSPIEFFIHDINHSRRMFQENEKYMKNINPSESIKIYEKSQKYLEHILKLFKSSLKEFIIDELKEFQYTHFDLNESCHKNLENGINAIIKIILFEIVHEDAMPLQNDIIYSSVLRPARMPVLFPRIVRNNNNLVIAEQKEFGGSILGFVKYKLRYCFFDRINLPNDKIVPIECRTDKHIQIACNILLKKICGICKVDNKIIICNITDKRGLNPPVHPDILSEMPNITTKYDYTDNEINEYRKQLDITEKNNFDGDRPMGISEYEKLSINLI